MNNYFKKILVIAAHPDDETLGCGGLIAKAISLNNDIRVVFIAEGSSSRFKKNDSNIEIKKAISKREESALKALEFLGVKEKEIFFNYRKCCQLDDYPLLEITQEIESHINSFKPTCIITHNPNDTNIDHRICYQALLPAVRPLKNCTLKLGLLFEILSSSEWNYLNQFEPNFFVDITNELESKNNSCNLYEGEMFANNHPRSPESIKALAKIRGNQSGHKYSEGFKLIFFR